MTDDGTVEALAGFATMVGVVLAIGRYQAHLSASHVLSQSPPIRVALTLGVYLVYCRIQYDLFVSHPDREWMPFLVMKLHTTALSYVVMMTTVHDPESKLHLTAAGATFVSMLSDLALIKSPWSRAGAIVCSLLTAAMPTASPDSFRHLELAFGFAFCAGVALDAVVWMIST